MLSLSWKCFHSESLIGFLSSSFFHHVGLNRLSQPVFGSIDTRDNISGVLVQQVSPVCLFSQRFSTANDDETVFSTSDSHIDPVLVLDEGARSRAYHRHENKIKLTPLRTVNRQDLIFHILLRKTLSNGILLSIVRRDYVDATLSELHEGDVLAPLVPCERLRELLKAEIFQLIDNFHFGVVVERSPLELLNTIGHVDEEEGGVGVHELLG